MFSDGRDFFETDHLVEIWGKPACPFCEKAKALSRQEGLDYIYHQLDEDFTREELLENYKAQEKKEQVVEWHNVVLVELL